MTLKKIDKAVVLNILNTMSPISVNTTQPPPLEIWHKYFI
jgi:hypothetical protein